jgi:hypothetical protein
MQFSVHDWRQKDAGNRRKDIAGLYKISCGRQHQVVGAIRG